MLIARTTSSRRRVRWTGAILALMLAGIVGWGSIRSGTGPAAGVGMGHATMSAPVTLRIATFNIHGGIAPSGKFDLVATAATLKNCDLIGLNEVHGSLFCGDDQARLLARQLKMDWLFAPAEHRWWHDSFGNALLSRIPITYWMRIPLPCTQQRGFRNAILVKTPLAGKTLQVLITHLDREKDGPAQRRAIRELFYSLTEPAILMGDLNADAADAEIRLLLAMPGVTDSLAGKSPAPHIDWIFLRGLHCREAGVIDNGASDHPALWADVELPR